MESEQALPPPKGFFHKTGFTHALNSGYAEVNPQYGLAPTIDLGGGFPVEEIPHNESLIAHPHIPYSILLNEWVDLPCDPVFVWQPFIEAMSDIHTGVVTLDAEDELGPELQALTDKSSFITDLHIRYEARAITDLRNRAQDSEQRDLGKHRTVSSEENDPEEPDRSSTAVRRDRQKVIREKALKLIICYRDQGLFHSDFQRMLGSPLPPDLQEWFSDQWNRVKFPEEGEILYSARLIELYLPVGLGELDDLAMILRDPDLTYREICAILDRWTTTVEKGTSPFPVASLPPHDLFRAHAIQVCSQLVAQLHWILFSTPNPTSYLIPSLPAIHFLLHPLLVWTQQPTVHIPFSYPWLAFAKDQVFTMLFEPSQIWDRDRIFARLDEVPSECHLYGKHPEDWVGPSENRTVASYALSIALHIWSFLRRLESLWHKEDPTCDHCKSVIRSISRVSQGDSRSRIRLSSALDNKMFTYYGLDPLLDAAKAYPKWLSREIQHTYYHHPSLPNPAHRDR